MPQHTTLTFFRYQGVQNRFWAISQMGIARLALANVPGLRFGRLLGSGGGNGFSLKPNFGVYAYLGHWESREAGDTFLRENEWLKTTDAHVQERLTVHLSPTMSHGTWSGEQPFDSDPAAYDPNAPVAVITRATINPARLTEFWSHVPRTSASLEDQADHLFSIGVGEFPVFMQATFSIWTNGKAMQNFAYKSRYHKEVVKLTRERGWHKEEMFTRFTILGAEGHWTGLDLSRLGL
ncbi:hypothetical protein [Neolewinella antarctica]|uniref:Spheroidene monooxygenase n=1 Tax=Neolewinella antarctica TaxID=442734 RepID=A0ABX0XFJ0_9BACT|nr:hypothetical protein [Neolewinella antarctica]NJC28089.1 hypothetical protein [Neolewinella antarctica]